MEIKKSTIYFLAIIFLILISSSIFIKKETNLEENVIASQGEIQEIVLGMKNFNYYPDKITAFSGKTVRISLDNTVYGCLRDFTIREIGIKKYLKTSSDYLEFTPTQKGTFTFACSMGMGYGKLIIK